MSEDTTSEADVAPNPVYVAHYQSHLEHIRDHLSGRVLDAILPPSLFSPLGCWTSEEKDAFFHALSVYSRLRPDLIADCIKTKNVMEVCIYMDLLEKAASLDGTRVQRKQISAAVEMSDTWIQFEEENAALVILAEPAWEAELIDQQREEEYQAFRLSIRPQKGSRKSTSDELNHRHEKLKGWKAERRVEWARDDTLRSLGMPHLKVIDNMLRDAEESMHNLPPTNPDLERADPTPETNQPPQNITDEMIDPTLRAMSTPSVPDIAPSTPSALPIVLPSATSPPPPTTISLDILSPASRRRHQKRLYMRRKRAQLTGKTTVAVSHDVGRLKPGRKTNKRKLKELAQGRERSASPSPSAENNLPETLQGSDPYLLPTAPMLVDGTDLLLESSTSRGIDATDINHHSAHDPSANARAAEDLFHTFHPHIGGETLHYRIKNILISADFGADALHENELDLFHFSALGKLMRLYSSMHDDIPVEVASSISSETLRLLQALVVHFLTEVVHRAIVVREQEQTSKIHTKVWRLSGEQVITATNVHHAVEILGKDISKTNSFSSLLNHFGSGTTADDADDSDLPPRKDVHSESENESEEEGKSMFPSLSSLHRDVYRPLIYFPRENESATVSDELMAAETDEARVRAELNEEDEIDSQDRMVDELHEELLWREFGREKNGKIRVRRGKRADDEDDEDDEMESGKPSGASLRFCEPGAETGVKSQVYINDSD